MCDALFNSINTYSLGWFTQSFEHDDLWELTFDMISSQIQSLRKQRLQFHSERDLIKWVEFIIVFDIYINELGMLMMVRLVDINSFKQLYYAKWTSSQAIWLILIEDDS